MAEPGPGSKVPCFIVGMLKSAPPRMPAGQRVVMVLSREQKRTPSGPCMGWSLDSETFQLILTAELGQDRRTGNYFNCCFMSSR